MVELEKKYEIGVRRFGLINWVGAWTLYKKEILRFLNVWIQTLFSPLITSLLFLLVLSLAIGNERGNVLGVPFINFLAPGLIAMSVIQQAFSHSSSSIMIGKIQGTIFDTISAPLSVKAIRRTMRQGLVDRFRMATDHEQVEQDWLRQTNDFSEGVRAMSERRLPDFKGN